MSLMPWRSSGIWSHQQNLSHCRQAVVSLWILEEERYLVTAACAA